jgi:hypothetical protein
MCPLLAKQMLERAAAAMQRRMSNPVAAYNIFSRVQREDTGALMRFGAARRQISKRVMEERLPEHTIAGELCTSGHRHSPLHGRCFFCFCSTCLCSGLCSGWHLVLALR